MSNDVPQGQATFRGRGLAFVHGSHIVVKVCPTCSQWNAPKAAERGVCGWCAYVPSCEDLKPTAHGARREAAVCYLSLQASTRPPKAS
ncbi:hypothetical protein LXM90_31855 (plasmid) [Methylobacterium oryzae]|nr:hypothetical protein [Methylobacterium sp. OT2]UIN38494.1 hypothetical protein LXM90_31855 [Methylobacterium oryzae]